MINMNHIRVSKHWVILIIVLFLSCKQKLQNTSISGTWTQVGYGRIIEIEDNSYTYFNTSESSCIPLVKGKLNDRFTVIKHNQDTLVLNPGGIVDYIFYRTDKLPDLCSITAKESNNNPLTNFNEFWQTFENNYAFFKERNINWDTIYREYKPKVENVTSNKELYILFEEIVGKFQDGHIRLDVPDSLKIKAPIVKRGKSKLSKKQITDDITTNYLLETFNYNKGVLKWGKIKDSDLGYIQINKMNNFSNYVSNQELNNESFEKMYQEKASIQSALELFQDEIYGVDYVMEKVLNNLKNTKAIIIDLRFNGGGYETVALQLLSYFVNERRHIITISAKTNKGTTPKQNYYLQPSRKHYTGDVYLLTSNMTSSAAEIFSLGAKNYSDIIQRIGSSTNGIFSEILWKKLPNNWEYSLSNEMYTDPSGNSFEIKGIPVDIDMNYPKIGREFYGTFYKNDIFKDVTIEKIIDTYE